MRFMLMHKVTDGMEKGLPPEAAVMEGVGKMMGDAMTEKIFVSGEGLKPTAQRLHIVYKDGKRTTTNGPFKEARELASGFLLLRVQSKEEAMSWLDKFAAVVGDVQLFLGPVVEEWDFGAPKPKDAPMRFLAVHLADDRSERDVPRDPDTLAKIHALTDAMTRAGVLEASGALASTKQGARIRFDGGRRSVMDGPFAESKELSAGYVIFELPSKADAITWATRFAEVVKVNEIDVREMQQGEPAGA